MGRPKSTLSEKERFISLVEKTNTCWLWKGCTRGKRDHQHYGAFQRGEKLWIASRASYDIFNGTIPDNMLVLHNCDNSLCVNPEHLRLGTHQDNMNDMKSRNRQASQSGENHGNNKLMEIDIMEIRILSGFSVSNVDIAKQFNISDGLVSMIVKGKRWKDFKFLL